MSPYKRSKLDNVVVVVVGVVVRSDQKIINMGKRGREGLLFCILRTYALFSELALFCTTYQENAHFPHQISC